MGRYQVHLSAVSSLAVWVDVDDDAEDPVEDAIEKAYDQHGAGICAQCGGWDQSWSLDLGDQWEPEAVEDKSGTEVWATKETWQRLDPQAE